MIDDNVVKVISCPRSQISSAAVIEESDLAAVHFSDALTFADETQPSTSLITQVGVEWNENSLFVFFRGRFENLRYSKNLSPELLGKKAFGIQEIGEVYEVVVGPKASLTKLYKQFQIAPDGSWFDCDINNALGISNPYWYSGCNCKSFVDEEMKIWSGIFELPWQCFGASYDSENVWNINFRRTVAGQRNKDSLTWASSGIENSSESFGKILFEY